MSATFPVFEVRQLQADDEAAVLAFELENRGYFARYVSDRGDEFYEQFSERHSACLHEQDAGTCVFHVLVDPDGAVLGRVNLYEMKRQTAVLGYRVAERAAGQGVTTEAVKRVVAVAERDYGLRLLRAVVADDNVPSQRVLQKADFVATGATEIHGRPATSYQRELRPERGNKHDSA